MFIAQRGPKDLTFTVRAQSSTTKHEKAERPAPQPGDCH